MKRVALLALAAPLLSVSAPAQACFESYSPLDARKGGMDALCVDVDLDGHLDIVTVNWASLSGSMRVLMGRGAGQFSPAVDYRAGGEPALLRSADLNGDGYPDLVVANYSQASVYLNQGDGTFASRVEYDPGVGSVDCVACADFDGDGDVDLALGNLDTSWLRIFRNLGNGTFVPPAAPVSTHGIIDLVSADVDLDGDPDLLSLSHPGNVEVFLNLGGGSFANPAPYLVSQWEVRQIASSDLDADGDPDIVVLGSVSNNSEVAVLLNQGGGVFGSPTDFPLTDLSIQSQLTLADLDGDGLPEVIVTGYEGVFVLGNLGNGAFLPTRAQATGGQPQATDAADIDGDGRVDLLVAGSQLWIMHNQGGWRFTEPPRIPLDRPLRQIRGADLDRDADTDLAVIEYASWDHPLARVRILGNDGRGGFDETASCSVGRIPIDLTATDLDGDGALDLVVANSGSMMPGPTGSLSILLNHGDGTFAPEVRVALDTYPRAITGADLDQDGNMDIVLLEMGPWPSYLGSLAVFPGDGHGALGPPTRYAVGAQPSELQIADLDGDGALDLLVHSWGVTWQGNEVSILRNLGNGTLAPALAVGAFASSLNCGDIDGDGDVDIVLGGNRLNVLLNSGTGTFGPPQEQPLGTGFSTTLLDVDGDGARDLVCSDPYDSTVSVLMNNGSGSFSKAGEFAAGTSATYLCVADFDADGDADVACVVDGGVALLRNCMDRAEVLCLGDGSAGPCPCNNTGAVGHGCENSGATGGAILSAGGFSNLGNDTLVLHSSDQLPSSVSVLLQGTLRISPVGFGDGLRCVSGVLKRLYVHSAVGGVLTVPQPGDLSISARSAAMGDTIGAGSTRLYQVYYRDPDLTFCPAPQGSSWNVSSGLAVRWLQ